MSDQPPPPPPPPPPSQPPPPPEASSVGSQLEPVGPWPRFGARIVDGLVLLVPNYLVALLLSGGDSATAFGTGTGIEGFLIGIVTTLIGFGYAVWLESTRGQTVGKMALGIKVIDVEGRVPAPEVASRRNAWLLLSIVPVLGGLAALVIAIWIGISISNDPFKRGVHDNFAGGTAVVRKR